MDDLEVFTHGDYMLAVVGLLGIAYNTATGRVVCHILTGTADKRECVTWGQHQLHQQEMKTTYRHRKQLATRNCP